MISLDDWNSTINDSLFWGEHTHCLAVLKTQILLGEVTH